MWGDLKKEATVLYKDGKYSEAADIYRRALQCDGIPDSEAAKIHTNISQTVVKQGRWEDVLTEAEEALRKDGNWWKGHSFKARALQMQRNFKDAGFALIQGVIACGGLADLLQDPCLLSDFSLDLTSTSAEQWRLLCPFTVQPSEGEGTWGVVGEALKRVEGLSVLVASVELVFVSGLQNGKWRMTRVPTGGPGVTTRLVEKPYEAALGDGTLSLVPGWVTV
uniref:Uncharacterized protein n=1 Tax=Chromera velia CCMP2878 TaxID=1169474 RepID=A0A0G4HV83_9ALVE|eukprot:Cvel_1392.t1-p1 / transcript=Cvel_1392.t1 / gene=Cvel_1392 / organism=Chromera_velia_CCMP2878 / gene_product=hypothetical protein / transcript_product=hypothetical protein / location=Cvel_scaffold48:102377-103131(+) / protein_length=221 / sequence_SO=supercontig / SO=protein_coding / is_pseudo=false